MSRGLHGLTRKGSKNGSLLGGGSEGTIFVMLFNTDRFWAERKCNVVSQQEVETGKGTKTKPSESVLERERKRDQGRGQGQGMSQGRGRDRSYGWRREINGARVVVGRRRR